jgi:hypothetical protein
MTWHLHYGKDRKPLLTVEPDAKHPSMWRIRYPDGQLSDMVNLTRAKDAAGVIALRDLAPSHEPKLLRWKWSGGESRTGAPPMR